MRTAGIAVKTISSLGELRTMLFGFRASRIVLTAFELGIFTALGKSRRNAQSVARELGTDPRGTDRLMNALCALRLLRKKNDAFANSPLAARYLVRGSPMYLAGLAHTARLWHSWSTLTPAVGRGGTVIRDGRKDRSAGVTGGFIASMHERASLQAADTVKLIDLSSVRRTLDIGGGSGAYSIAMARAEEKIRATVFDLPEVVRLAEEYVRREGLAERFAFLPGDFNRNGFGGGYDLVLLSAIVHMNPPERNRRLLSKAAKALNPKGQLVIQDYIMNGDRTRPALGAIFALNMLVGTEGGDTYTEAEVREWMKEAGLSGIVRRDTPFSSSLMIGWKR
jgi:2-polyprenyl-3-methyl-5-hydroxy-6-metoxy-1,4-benzoquinol methylase